MAAQVHAPIHQPASAPASAPASTPSLQAVLAAYARAILRAANATWVDVNGDAHLGLVAFRTDDPDAFDVPALSKPQSYHRVRRVGNRLICDCAGCNHPACIHRAVVREAIKARCFAKRIAPRVPANVLPFPAIDIAAEQARLAEVNARAASLFD